MHPSQGNSIGLIVSILAGVVVMVAAPYLGAWVLGVEVSLLSAGQMATVMAVAGALSSAAQQGVAIAFDLQNGFSVQNMLLSGIETGLGYGAMGIGTKTPGMFDVFGKGADYAYKLVKMAGVVVSSQLLEMALGVRDKFDMGAIVVQIGGAAVNLGLDSIPGGDKLIGVNTLTPYLTPYLI